MKAVPRRIKRGDLIEVRGIDWETTIEWIDLDKIEGDTPKSELCILGYIRTERDGTVVWAGMLESSCFRREHYEF